MFGLRKFVYKVELKISYGGIDIYTTELFYCYARNKIKALIKLNEKLCHYEDKYPSVDIKKIEFYEILADGYEGNIIGSIISGKPR